ncbi:hypothetical protein GCK32_006722 [Trichostrongylus colubriformis]|uniref:Uncharacterized protein n=1 Tax=Trichostrongylus colubriformis TaxID=6319 RepID=A0AAN8FNN7_TRICO
MHFPELKDLEVFLLGERSPHIPYFPVPVRLYWKVENIMPTEKVTFEIQVYMKRSKRPDLYHFKTFSVPVNSPQNMTKEIRFLEDMSHTAWDVMNVTIVPVIEEYKGKPATMIYQTLRVPTPRNKHWRIVRMNSIVTIDWYGDEYGFFWELLTPETARTRWSHRSTQQLLKHGHVSL